MLFLLSLENTDAAVRRYATESKLVIFFREKERRDRDRSTSVYIREKVK